MNEENKVLPVVASRTPIKVKVEKGTRYFWCTCGLSEKQPLCDGAHQGTEFRPKKYVATADEELFFCNCKHTKKAPLCDGSHSKAPLND